MHKVYWGNRNSKFGLKTYPKVEFFLLRAEFYFKPIGASAVFGINAVRFLGNHSFQLHFFHLIKKGNSFFRNMITKFDQVCFN